LDDKNLKLKSIVPEYSSKNFLVNKLFWDRLSTSVALSGADKSKKILDMGAGAGHLIRLLIKKGVPPDNIYALDFNVNFLRLKKLYPGAHLSIGDLKNTGYSSGQFDVVFCLDVLEHIKDIEAALSELVRISKKGASLVVSIPKENFLYKVGRFLIKGRFSMESGPGSGKHYYTDKELVSILKRRFKLVRVKKLRVLGIFHFFTICKFRMRKGQK
jgi:2-polyprenyl-3-methyl-5-hydroxy-6-metoxy-1,4-benzoquinol methylase